MTIKFGTSGWRAIIAEDFTFANVGRVTRFANRRVTNINRLDGVKIILEDDSWVLLRPSGTEPLVRIYAEASSRADLEVFLEQGRKYLLD